MNKNFNIIINTLIIALIVALVYVMMNYYAGTPSTIPTNIDVIHEDILPNNNEETIISNNTKQNENENDAIINIVDSGEKEENSGDTSGDTKEENTSIPETNNDKPQKEETPPKDNPVIITSENETSSKEKREILTQLDKTLMELLEVVDKVQTVDESRLIIDDSEVQQ